MLQQTDVAGCPAYRRNRLHRFNARMEKSGVVAISACQLTKRAPEAETLRRGPETAERGDAAKK
jgi:hypothetical protein